jgi:hypothetical protein
MLRPLALVKRSDWRAAPAVQRARCAHFQRIVVRDPSNINPNRKGRANPAAGAPRFLSSESTIDDSKTRLSSRRDRLAFALFHVPRVACQPVIIVASLPYCVKHFGKKTIMTTG